MLKGKIRLNGELVDLVIEFSNKVSMEEVIFYFPENVNLDSWQHAIYVKTDLDRVSEELRDNKVTNNGYGVYFCPQCHKSVWQVPDESRYCFRCGCQLKWD